MMIYSLSESMGPENSCSKPQSPLLTASISESNNISTSEFNHKYHINPLGKFEDLKFEADVEVQSPDISVSESLFFDQLDFGTANFMISSPRRDFMIFSPRRDFMIYSPKRDFMNSSPNRDFMVSSPKRDFMNSSPNRDFMVSSPKRDFMSSSPIRDFMVSSPKRDLMVSSPKRNSMNSSPKIDFMASPSKRDFFISSPKQECMVSSPKRTLLPHSSYTSAEAGVHGPRCNQSLLGCCSQYWSNSIQMGARSTSHKGKPQSPLHKVLFNSTQFVQTENPPLPTMDGFLDDHLGDDFGMYPNPTMKMPDAGRCGPESLDTAAVALPGMLDCLPLRNLSSFGSMSDEGCLTQERDVFQMSSFAASPQLLRQQKHLQKNLEQEQDSGLQLVHLLLVCAEAVAKNDHMSAKRFLQQLNQVVTPLGDSMLRVASYFTDGLATRLTASLNSNPNNYTPKSLVPFPQDTVEIRKIYQILYQACPYVKFAHFTANQAIFEAFQGEDRVHVIDLDIIQGYQWPAFMRALAARPGGPPFLRITGVGASLEFVRETGRHLTDLAHSLHVPFKFHPVGEHLGDLQPHMFHRRVGEALAVNCVNRLNRVSGNRLGNLGWMEWKVYSFHVFQKRYAVDMKIEVIAYLGMLSQLLDLAFQREAGDKERGN
ncbi:hypothetical protein MRB53_005949 [Persea americana]|uniref:Uncharacterized protein n=1 Tax=Persea americana TaxID=3435 RepID=A0ACC2MEJ8_PERAE|nr:hypothetical protein MRB53_005949 [Persea americana]